MRQGHDAKLPGRLTGYHEAPAYYGVVCETLASYGMEAETGQALAADVAVDIENLIAKRKIRDWVHTEDVLKGMQNDIDDYLFDLRDQHGVPLAIEDMDAIIERCLAIARKLAGDA